MTLLQSIEEFLGNITVTDRQEESIKSSLSNLNSHLTEKGNDLHVTETFTTGAYDRDTNIRPLTDIDLFAVLNREEWQNGDGSLPTCQSVLTKLKDYLNGIAEYEGKVRQDRPCVTVELSNKDFDILPSFADPIGGYLIPNHALSGWAYSNPEQLASNLNYVNRLRNYKVKPSIKAVKHWKRENSIHIPSYHVEEVAISMFQFYSFTNFEESIRLWFNQAEHYLDPTKFAKKSGYDAAIKAIRNVKTQLEKAKQYLGEGNETKAKEIWKDTFGREFPAPNDLQEEAKLYSKSLASGVLKITSAGTLSTNIGYSLKASTGYFGDEC